MCLIAYDMCVMLMCYFHVFVLFRDFILVLGLVLLSYSNTGEVSVSYLCCLSLGLGLGLGPAC